MNDSAPPSPLRALAHELRNAIAPVRNAAHLLRKRATGDPLVSAALQTIDNAVAESLRLIDGALDAERVMADDVALSKAHVDLAAIVELAVGRIASTLAARHQRVDVRIDGDPRVHADAARLAQSLAALIEAASREHDEGAALVVSAEAGDGEVRVRVPGGGAPSAAPALPLARKLVELHGGRLETSADAQALVALPAAEGADALEPASEASAGRARSVLLVDDNRAVRESYADVLGDFGCRVDTAADGEQAIARAIASKPRFVILDVNLPKRNGYEVARALRERFGRDEMTLVMISGTELDEATVASARAAGFDHWLDKASDLAALRRLLGC